MSQKWLRPKCTNGPRPISTSPFHLPCRCNFLREPSSVSWPGGLSMICPFLPITWRNICSRSTALCPLILDVRGGDDRVSGHSAFLHIRRDAVGCPKNVPPSSSRLDWGNTTTRDMAHTYGVISCQERISQ